MATVTFTNASCTYPGATKPAVDALNLTIKDGEFLVLVGPSGCGKSTSLRMVAGLEDVSGGTIHIGPDDVTHLPPRARDIAMVFQSYALYPHMTVGENMGFALKVAKKSKAEIAERVMDAAKLLGLEELLDRKPKALSGGQRQRVAMGRAIVREPRVFLMDEPLSNLDAKLRVQTRAQIATLQKRLATTTIYVTHDQVEAMTMGHRVAVMNEGKLQQVDTPRALYDTPANAFVAGFIGSPSMNLLTALLDSDGAKIAGATVDVPREVLTAATTAGDEITIGFRPEAINLRNEDPDSQNARVEKPSLTMSVNLVEELGSDAYIYGQLSDGTAIVARTTSHAQPDIGDTLVLSLDPTQLHFFDPTTGERL